MSNGRGVPAAARIIPAQMKILVTGVAGFIGASTAQQLLTRGDEVVGIDNLNDYYDVSLKEARLALLKRRCRADG
jgi:UDP-glucuronate 4-epimerase